MCPTTGAIISLYSKVVSGFYSMRPKLPDYSPHEVVWHQDAGLRKRSDQVPIQNLL